MDDPGMQSGMLGRSARASHPGGAQNEHTSEPPGVVAFGASIGYQTANNIEDASKADLLVIAFPTEAQAEEVRARVFGMQREYLIELGDAVVAIK